MPIDPDRTGFALEPELGLVRDGFTSDGRWSFVLGFGILGGRL
jgi:hypothetical protein